MNPAALAAKQKNARRILDFILIHGEASRAQLSSELSISTATVTNIVTELIEQNLLCEGRQEPSSSGKRTTLLEFNTSRGIIITYELGVRHTTLAACNFAGETISLDSFPFDPTITIERPEMTVLKEIINNIRRFISALSASDQKLISAIGISVCGMVNAQRIIDAPSICWNKVNLIKPLQAALGYPVYCEGITRIKAFYEMRFIRPEEKNILYLNLYDGVGMVNFFKGKMIIGKTGIAGEVGHMSLNLHGPKCYCGNRGCFELYCGMRPILEQARALLIPENKEDVFYDMVMNRGKEVTPELLFEAEEAGSLVIHTLLCSVAEYLGAGLSALYNIYDPDRIILSGYLDGERDFITGRAISEARSRIINPFSRELLISSAHLSNRQNYLAICAYAVSGILDQMYK